MNDLDEGTADEAAQARIRGPEGLARCIANLHHANPFRQACLDLIRWPPFDAAVIVCILINTLVMMLKWVPGPSNPLEISINLDDWNTDYLSNGYFIMLNSLNTFLTLLFACESAIKIIALGRLFPKDSMNVFDVTIVAFSALEIVLDYLKRYGNSSFKFPLPLSALRTFRVFRLFKLAKKIESIRKVFNTLSQSFSSVLYLACLLGLVILIFILLGMELFGGLYPRPELNYTKGYFPQVWSEKIITWGDDNFPSRYHFDDFGNAMLVVFVVLSGENWNEIMFDNHLATWQHDTSTGLRIPFAVPYFILLFIVGNLVLFNLFVAILLSNFGEEEEEEEPDEPLADDEEIETAAAQVKRCRPAPP